MLKQFSLIVVGGGLGSLIRYLVSLAAFGILKEYPLGTLTVNIVGCFLIGLLLPLFSSWNESWRLFIIVGVLGGLTTFSSYGSETVTLFKRSFALGGAHLLLNNALGLAAVWLGETIATKFKGG